MARITLDLGGGSDDSGCFRLGTGEARGDGVSLSLRSDALAASMLMTGGVGGEVGRDDDAAATDAAAARCPAVDATPPPSDSVG